jgi:hypothetical protein
MVKHNFKKTHKKSSKKQSIHTVKELHDALQHIRQFSSELVNSTGTIQTKVTKFQSEWRKTFHRKIDSSAAEAYLSFIAKVPGAAGSKKQSGGSGAPINYEMQPGVEGVYGKFPAYLANGLDAGLGYHNSQMDLCGKVDTTPPGASATGFGSVSQNLVGGQRRRKYTLRKQRGGVAFLDSFMQRPLTSDVPTSVATDAMFSWKGVPAPASPDPSQTTHSYLASGNVNIPGINISQITRTGADITSV